MRLGILFLLVTLALCCYQANAVVCPNVLEELTAFLTGDDSSYKMILESYNPPPEDIEAKLEVKKCLDQISAPKKQLIINITGKIVSYCDMQTLF
ncbi:secretoglobin family 1D member 4-like [Dasypus novemcinctus]|uniref:secretoglobin family 1D member 4-like n=1 Tax=Dasypus novemcinctus TaxID=9361 RepID=UPI0003289F3F|nr:secretoglobin family 1D member 4-like [Dasypus novemcinctus]